MKRRFANRVNGYYIQERIENDYFVGTVTHIKLNNIEKPVFVNNGFYDLCVIKNDYEWIGLYPDKELYALTIMIDDDGNVIQWYFDIAKALGIENGIPYEDDLFLDMIITKEGNKIVVDEDELLSAKDKGEITKEDVENAYKTLKYLEGKYVNDIPKLVEFTNYLSEHFNNKKKL